MIAILMAVVLFVSWNFISGKNENITSDTAEASLSSAGVNVDSPEIEENNVTSHDSSRVSINSDTLISAEDPDSVTVNTTIPAKDKDVVVLIYDESEEKIVTGTFSTHGGGVTSWELMMYPDNPGSDQNDNVNFNGGTWLFCWDADNNPIDFVYSGPDTIEVIGEAKQTLLFHTPDGACVEYTFTAGFYGFNVDITKAVDTFFPYIPAGVLPVSEQQVNASRYFKAEWYAEKVKGENSKDLETELPTGNVRWLATRSHYFAIILLPESNDLRAYGKVFACNEDQSPSIGISDNKITVYAGPLDYNELQKLGRDTRRLIDFGWPIIREIGRLIFLFSDTVLSFVNNWGLKIIILSIALKVLLLPLTQKSFKSMARMKEVQPKMKEIQAKYKNDPKAQQQAMQKLYKDEGVNPLGGCLPMIMQMPVFFALYRVLANSVQLRGAPFFLWIQDLSRPEILIPFNTPILGLHGIGLLAVMMGVAMFFQQKLTMTDQSQKGMMYMMPLFMMFIFMRFPAGLTLYWFTNNLLTIVQQEFIKKQLQKAEAKLK